MRRLFFAISIPEEEKRLMLHSFPQKNFHGIRWVSEKNLHITSHFLGAVDEEKIPSMIERVKAICSSLQHFKLKFESFKTVHKDRKVVMIWAQFEESEAFEKLCHQLREVFPTIEKRKPLPHLTLARIKQLHELPFDLPGPKTFSIEVKSLELWESHLSSKGSEYEMIEQWKLNG